jgi:hypothetical protein
MRPLPHASHSLHVPGELIDEDTVMGYGSMLCKHRLDRPDVPFVCPMSKQRNRRSKTWMNAWVASISSHHSRA